LGTRVLKALLGGFPESWSFKGRIPKLELGNEQTSKRANEQTSKRANEQTSKRANEQALNIRQTVDRHKDTCPPYATRAGID